jgi:hypothetical protein
LADPAMLPNPPNGKTESNLICNNNKLQKLNSRQIAIKLAFNHQLHKTPEGSLLVAEIMAGLVSRPLA